MSLHKAIQHKKEYRKPFYGSKSVDATCRCHGSCNYCLDNRLFSSNKNRFRAQDELNESLREESDLSWEEYRDALDLDVDREIFGD